MLGRTARALLVQVARWIPGGAGITVTCGRAGFFGELFTTLNGLRAAEKNGLSARIRWDETSKYFETGIGPNVWKYYFEQSEFDFSGGIHEDPRFIRFKPGADDFDPYEGYSVRESAGIALDRWCQLKAEIVAAVDDFADANFNRETVLGVHVRLTDAAAGHENRKSVELDDVFDAVDRWAATNADCGIFLATDDQRAIAAFEERYPGRVIFQECLRSTDGTSIHGHYDAGVEGSPYTKGLEVLIDALLLARCDHLVRTHSRVTCFTLCWNPQLTYTDLELELLGEDRTPWLHEPRTATVS